MIQNCTNLEQSRELIRLGLEQKLSCWKLEIVETIDGVHEEIPRFSYNNFFSGVKENEVKAWGPEILEIFPDKVGDYKFLVTREDGVWELKYINKSGKELIKGKAKNLYDAVIRLIKEVVKKDMTRLLK